MRRNRRHSLVQNFLNSSIFYNYERPFYPQPPFTHVHRSSLDLSLTASYGPCYGPLLSFLLQHLMLQPVCPTNFPALCWQTVGGVLKAGKGRLDSFHKGYPGRRLIGKVIYCPLSVLNSSFTTFPSIYPFVYYPLQIHTCCLEVKVSVGVTVSVCMRVFLWQGLKGLYPLARIKIIILICLWVDEAIGYRAGTVCVCVAPVHLQMGRQ